MQSAMKGIACLGLLAALCSVRGAAAQEPARHAVGLELRGDTMIYRSVVLPCRHGAGNHVWSGYAYEPWTPAQKVFALSKFWSEARRSYVRMDRVGAERWDSLYLSLIEPARRTRNDDEFYRLMQRFCAFLEDEHTFVAVDRNYPQSAESFGDGWVLSLVTIDGRVVVNEVARAKAAEVPPGSEVVSVDGRPAAECLAGAMLRVSASNERARRYKAAGELLRGLAGTEHEVEFRRPDGSSVRVRLVNASGEYGDSDLASLPGRDRRSLRAPFRLEWYPGDVAYVKLGSFRPGSAVKAFHDAFPEIQGRARKLILDLRGNGGGRNRVAAHIMAHFSHDTLLCGGTWRTRTYHAAYASWGAQAEAKDTVANPPVRAGFENYRGLALSEPRPHEFRYAPDRESLVVPTVILTDAGTCSSAENFLIMADSQPHMTRIGSATSGCTASPVVYELIPGMRCGICTREVRFPDGREYVGIGIAPDIEVVPTLADWLEGRDPVLERALEYLADK